MGVTTTSESLVAGALAPNNRLEFADLAAEDWAEKVSNQRRGKPVSRRGSKVKAEFRRFFGETRTRKLDRDSENS
jgi:hypothetical protein